MQETAKSLRQKGICPTCYNFEHGGVYGGFSERLLLEDDLLYCFFEERPRSVGHTIILLKEHVPDMSFLHDDTCERVFTFAKKVMIALKETLGVEKVYLCTMCDGAVNHFHLQLIPRHPATPIGSTNFVKERKGYVHDSVLVQQVRDRLANHTAS